MQGVHLSELLGRSIVAADGQRVGKLADVIVALGERGSYPQVTGLIAKVSGRDLFVAIEIVAGLSPTEIRLRTARLDVRPFERREGEVLLRADVLGHRLIDVPSARLVRAYDLDLEEQDGRWSLSRVGTTRHRRLPGFVPGRKTGGPHETRNWSEFEALIGHSSSVGARNPLARLRRLRPAQIADLVEDADRRETAEILQAVHGDVELEADVFEEMEADRQVEVLKDRSDAEVAEMLTHMRSDDAADLIADLPQNRRIVVLGLLPPTHQMKVRTLLGFNPATAGGLMNPDFLALPCDTTVAAALARVRDAEPQIPQEVLAAVYVTNEGVLSGSLTLQGLLRARSSALLSEVAEPDPVHVHPDADLTEVAIRMADFNLTTIPVIDDTRTLVGVVTVDDVLEVTIPDDWRRREEGAPTSDRPKPDAELLPSSADERV
ncbi:MAG: magnesium transporter MgtE N-terminal domain-containing protein [Acidimicrobiales bacterium]